jgi:hypothetical protein
LDSNNIIKVSAFFGVELIYRSRCLTVIRSGDDKMMVLCGH